ncbi:MAG: hypothetical protein ACPGXK_06085 [Phycisphaerae bacterium]
MMNARVQVEPSEIRHRRASAFSLVELLTVVFIISLLIAILIPSLSRARVAAKKATTDNTVKKSLEQTLELFKNDNERDFPQTSGYPTSFAHPPIRNATFDPFLGEFPFVENGQPAPANGAHWLPAMLMGVDQQGYVPRKNVPASLVTQPDRWYSADPLQDSSFEIIPRADLYIEPGVVKTVLTKDLRGRPNEALSPSFDDVARLPVFVDSFDQPILYYAANRFGKPRNMVEQRRDQNNSYAMGPPIYFHEDNKLFTGDDSNPAGWKFQGNENHKIALSGHMLDANQILEDQNRDTFATFILDRQYRKQMEEGTVQPTTQLPLRPVNPKRFILISAGADAIYGTPDDITNFPLSVE